MTGTGIEVRDWNRMSGTGRECQGLEGIECQGLEGTGIEYQGLK